MLKILHARLRHYVNQELPDVQAGFRRGRGTRDPIAKICWFVEKAREVHHCLLRNMYVGQEATVRIKHGTTDWLKIEKGVCQGCILSPCLFNSMQSTSCKTLGWMNHKLESRLLGEISITSDMQMTPLLWQKVKKN